MWHNCLATCKWTSFDLWLTFYTKNNFRWIKTSNVCVYTYFFKSHISSRTTGELNKQKWQNLSREGLSQHSTKPRRHENTGKIEHTKMKHCWMAKHKTQPINHQPTKRNLITVFYLKVTTGKICHTHIRNRRQLLLTYTNQ